MVTHDLPKFSIVAHHVMKTSGNRRVELGNDRVPLDLSLQIERNVGIDASKWLEPLIKKMESINNSPNIPNRFPSFAISS
jgi:hypothetical protein